MSPPNRSTSSRHAMAKELSDFGLLKETDIVETLAAIDRRRQRHEHTFLEAKKARRGKERKKPFYLIMDQEGKPYGTGKPSWIAEINKLAKYFHPSCMHIRKQTYEDVQTFRDKLDENFEYSRPLNEDYLRALIDRAVTRKRGELVSFIKNNGEQPKHMDKQVWLRLKKLAISQQREQKLEQGRHANACRKVIGRTGKRGTDGIRKKLRLMLRRSPDPSEVDEELQRDKGFGGRKRKNIAIDIKPEKKSSKVVLVDEDMNPLRSASTSYQVDTGTSSKEARECHGEPVNDVQFFLAFSCLKLSCC